MPSRHRVVGPEHERQAGPPDHAAERGQRPRRMADDAIESLRSKNTGERAARPSNGMRPAEPDGIQEMGGNPCRFEGAGQAAREAQRDLMLEPARRVGGGQSHEKCLDPAEQVAAVDMKNTHQAIARW